MTGAQTMNIVYCAQNIDIVHPPWPLTWIFFYSRMHTNVRMAIVILRYIIPRFLHMIQYSKVS